MAALDSADSKNLDTLVENAKVLVVGAGGIGCELLKNLVLSGFGDIVTIDLDTIDVSNLNRQFLFHKEHVGKSKAIVARESALSFNPNVKIEAIHDSVMNPQYNTQYFKQFTLVMNALDNRAARSHVNRMCLAADVPLIESGTAGYLGQVTVIKKNVSECYDCQPKAAQKSFPGCTIRNTPSEPIHCIVWAKHLFNQLFGEADPDEDVSPDTADPEAVGNAGEAALSSVATESGNVARVSTRAWARQCEYDPRKLFGKFFYDDVKYLLSMGKLWEKRKPPTPLDWENLPETAVGNGLPVSTEPTNSIKDQRVWSPSECAKVMAESVQQLYQRLKDAEGGSDHLVWDKDDPASMDFVTACANLRALVYGILQKSRFDVKSMAGNIVPAIATTNAVIAGLILFEAFKILQGRMAECSHTYLNQKPNALNKLIAPSRLDKPNPKCFVCSPQPEVTVVLNVKQMTIRTFQDKVLKGGLTMICPDVMVDDGKGTVLISSDEEETADNMNKFLADFNIVDGARLKCDDFQQEYNLNITIMHREKLDNGADFEIIGDPSQLQAAAKKDELPEPAASTSAETASKNNIIDIDDELNVVYFNGVEDGQPLNTEEKTPGLKRPVEDSEDQPNAKKLRAEPVEAL